MKAVQAISAAALSERLKQQSSLFLLDVREPHEVAICAIQGAKQIAMNLIPIYIDEIPDDTDIIVYCHHGVRSLAVANYLIENGFDPERIYNLTGGIDFWAQSIDPTLARY